ncbi:hypothetical protein BDA99DRAFT_438986 [Phascolomyces articulosus]|uniref:Reverse transcriptase zinc-binding domain-containing protein n=1 Tax=Phascolomyces articulosus TaxID=60185 RepID=A0AAD5JZE1_9FUNG|nr:hypothetical protein BDA99DRAFT_438986 [Phascolomyces articulosus]
MRYLYWWRILHKKISCKQRLNQLIPRIFTLLNCVFSNELDMIEHFFWECPY